MMRESGLTADDNNTYDMLIEDLWRDLGGRITRDRIRLLVEEVAAEFQEATVTAFIPVFIRRRIYETLKNSD